MLCGVLAKLALSRSDSAVVHDEARIKVLCRLLVDLIRGRSNVATPCGSERVKK